MVARALKCSIGALRRAAREIPAGLDLGSNISDRRRPQKVMPDLSSRQGPITSSGSVRRFRTRRLELTKAFPYIWSAPAEGLPMHFKKLDLNLLVVFSALMSHRNVTRAAEELGVSQPALSHALTRLRNYYQDPLFFHVKGAMLPSARAEELFEPISKALDLIAETFESKFDPASLRRTFRIALVEYAALFLLPTLVLKLRAEAPDVQLAFDYMNEKKAEQLLMNRDIDFAIGVFSPPNDACLRETIAVDRFVCISRLGHKDVGKKLTIAKYTKLEHVRLPFYNSIIDSALKDRGLSRKFSIKTENAWSVPFLVAKSDALATIPERIAFVFRQFCQVNVFELPFEIDSFNVDIVWHQNAQTDPANIWLRQIIKAAANDIYWDMGAPRSV
jgi:DNA-binding transcriptional LysR family regulator